MISTTTLNTPMTFVAAQLGTVRIAGNDASLEMSKAEALKLYTWLNGLNDALILAAEPTFYPAIKNAIHPDGTPFPETFGTVQVRHSDATQIHEFDHCSDGSLLICNIHTNAAICLDQAGTLQLLGRLQYVNAEVQQ